MKRSLNTCVVLLACAALVVALMALSACIRVESTPTQSSSDESEAVSSSASSESAPVRERIPKRIEIGKPTAQFESGGERGVIVNVTAPLSCKPVDVPLFMNGCLVAKALDAKGKSVQKSPGHVGKAIARNGKLTSATWQFLLSPGEFEAMDSIQVTCVSVDGIWGLSITKDAQKVADAKATYEVAERDRAERERAAAWRAKFPTDDYSNTLLIGDSLMQNAQASLEAAMPNVDINADAGRTLERGGLVFENSSPDAGVLDHVRDNDGSHARYVIGTGNNDAGGVTEEDAEEIIACLGPDKEIYFITMMVTGNPGGTATTNATIEAMAAKYPNVHVIDWYGLVEGHESEYLSDGCHARRDREPDYAACIKDGLDVVY